MLIFIKILRESLVLTLQQLWQHRLRTFLSLLGVTVGIFSIIAILTAVDGLQRNVEGSISKLGDDLVMIQKWPLYTGKEYPWWKYVERPDASHKDFRFIRERSQTVGASAFTMEVPGGVVEYGSRSLRGLNIQGVTHDYEQIVSFSVEKGRYFTEQESYSGYHVAVIGAAVADRLFEEGRDPLDKEVQVDNIRVRIIGVLEREGQDILGFNFDEAFLVPHELVQRTMSIEIFRADPTVFIHPRPSVAVEEMMAEVEGLMRSHRRLRPLQEDDFSLVRFSLVTNSFGNLLKALNMAGWIIGAFALLVGGFGIANIMYVSVQERTSVIGIKKALGARRSYVLFEFLTESVMLCLIGGLAGLLIIAVLLAPVSASTNFDFRLTWENVAVGLGVSAVIGVLAGILPAMRAAALNPVDAIRAR